MSKLYNIKSLSAYAENHPDNGVEMDECVKNRPKMKYCCYLPALTLRQTGGRQAADVASCG
ncbi:MAG: hypothetical protein H8E14_05770 [Candidatus Marinimicrobia bacterium]|nr:hypothetical protein [Candidatus Neomarinimicrobiota bacterium]